MTRWSPLLLLVFACACTDGSQAYVRYSKNVQSVVYGRDDRVEAIDESNDLLREHALRATAAIVSIADVSIDGEIVELRGAPLTQSEGLCDDEPLAHQPSVAACTGVLAGASLVLTAGHCLAKISCARMSLVFGYSYQEDGTLRQLKVGDIYSCSEVVDVAVDAPSSDHRLDYAWIRLDREVAPELRPVDLSGWQSSLAQGQSVALVGHVAGTPVKVAGGSMVVDPRLHERDYFVADLDNAEGGSGSGVFGDDGTLLGIAVRGEPDYVPTLAGCNRANRLEREAHDDAEEVNYLEPALRALCTGHASIAPKLCADVHKDSRVARCNATLAPRYDVSTPLVAFMGAGIWFVKGHRRRDRSHRQRT